MTLRRVCGATISGRLSTRETVAVETPARLATAKILGTEFPRIAEIIASSKKTCPPAAVRLASCKRLHKRYNNYIAEELEDRPGRDVHIGGSPDLVEHSRRMHDDEGYF